MRAEPVTVLLVEDDPAQRAVLEMALSARGMRTLTASTGWEAMRMLQGSAVPDVVLLDLGLPDTDGVDLCRRIRPGLASPIVVVTAQTDDDRVVEALDAGADDYVTKPFSMPVLLARLRVALRHGEQVAAATPDGVLEAGTVRLDLAAHQAQVSGETVALTAKMFALLSLLVRNQGKVVTYAGLAAALGGDPNDPDDRNAWRVSVSRLRKQIGVGPGRPEIHTELNVGYRLVVPEE